MPLFSPPWFAFVVTMPRYIQIHANNQQLTEMAMNWVLDHMGDADFNDPLPSPKASSCAAPAAAAAAADPTAVAMLTSFGFTERQAEGSLKATGGDAARAADWLYSHMDDLDAAVAEVWKITLLQLYFGVVYSMIVGGDCLIKKSVFTWPATVSRL